MGQPAETASQSQERGGRTLRKRRQGQAESWSEGSSTSLQEILCLAESANKLVVFSGSGLSATSGMSTFTTPGGLYDRARKRFKLSDGKKLFNYSFFEKRRFDCMAFLADIYQEAVHAQPSAGHRALAALWGLGKLQRHYTLNIDGLCETAGMDTWQPMPCKDSDGEDDMEYPRGAAASTVEMHGNISLQVGKTGDEDLSGLPAICRQLVCTECKCWAFMDRNKSRQVQRKQKIVCTNCEKGKGMRPRVMLYDDNEGDAITPDDVWDIMKDDVVAADMIVWVGISFEQSASTAYFRRVRQMLMEENRQGDVHQVIVNPSEEAHWNVVSACSNMEDFRIFEVRSTGDTLLPALVDLYKSQQKKQNGSAANLKDDDEATKEEQLH